MQSTKISEANLITQSRTINKNYRHNTLPLLLFLSLSLPLLPGPPPVALESDRLAMPISCIGLSVFGASLVISFYLLEVFWSAISPSPNEGVRGGREKERGRGGGKSSAETRRGGVSKEWGLRKVGRDRRRGKKEIENLRI